MFTLTDGRDYLYQWDIDRTITVADPTVSEVHFCNRTDDCSLVVQVVGGIANIPNILLQSPFDIRVYAYCNCYTKVEETFKVKARTKPSEYVYTETEILQYSDIANRMATIEDNIGEEVSKYLEEHPVEVDLTGYAKEEYVDNAIDSIVFPEPDLKPYATKNYVDNQIDSATKDLASTGYVDNAIAELEPAKPDLTGYATESWVKNQGYINSIPSDYVTELELSAKGYAKNSDLSIYAKKAEIPTVPTKVSQLENDKGYLTEHQSLAGYATTVYVDKAIEGIEFPEMPELDDYYTKEQTYSKAEVNNKLKDYAKTADIPSLEGYATTKYVDNAIAGIEIPEASETDLSNYYTKDEVKTAIYDAKDTYYLDFTNATTTAQTATQDMVEFASRLFAKENVCAHIKDADWTGVYRPAALIHNSTNEVELIQSDFQPTMVNSSTVYNSYVINYNGLSNTWTYKKRITSNITLVDKAYVDAALTNKEYATTGWVNIKLGSYAANKDLELTKNSATFEYLMLSGLYSGFNPYSTADIDQFKHYSKYSSYASWSGEDTVSDINGSVTVIKEDLTTQTIEAPLQLLKNHMYLNAGGLYVAFESVNAYRNYFSGKLKYDHTQSGLKAKTIKSAIDELSSKIDNIDVSGGGSTDLTNYYTKTEVDALIPDVSAYQTADQVNTLINTALSGIATAEGGAY